MKKGNSDPLTPKLQAEIEALEARKEKIDTSDMPEVTDWTGARRGVFYRPVKQLMSLRLDADVIAWFKSQGEGYQTRINNALREYIERHHYDKA
jgi:uncharacterized protein (DUF4415 family)